MLLKKITLLLLLATLGLASFAQHAQIKGSVIDSVAKRNLQNSSILLIRNADSVLVSSQRANKDGYFEFNKVPKGRYNVLVTYPKMADYITTLNLSDSSKIDFGKIHMELQSTLIDEIVIRAQKDAVRIKGDTITYQADSFKVAEGANVQELLKRLPGFELDKDGNIKAQGKDVVNVLVDGDEFFGDDPLMATKYLKAKSVKEIEVYDKKSKNAELTGIDDGKKEKTVNIKLKDNAKNGYLSNIDANGATGNFYDYGGMFGVFKNKMKAAIYGTKANIGLQSKVSSAMNSMKGNDYDMIEVGDDGSVMMFSMGGMDDDYYRGNGLPNNLIMGAHYSDKWNNNKQGLKLNYKYSDKDMNNLTTAYSQQLLPNGTVFVRNSNNRSFSNSIGNDLKGNFEMKVDSLSTLKVSLGINKNTSKLNNVANSETQNNDLRVSNNQQNQSGTSGGDVFNGNINFTKKFKTAGRTFTMDLQPELKNNNSKQNSLNLTNYYNNLGALERTDNLNLYKDNSGAQNSIASKISYSEPIGKRFLLQASYAFKNVYSESFKSTYDNLILSGGKPKLVDSLSNNFKFNSMSHVGKGVMQFKYNRFSVNGGVEATQTDFSLNDLDRNNKFNRSYLNVAPSSNMSLRIGKNSSFSVYYNGRTQQPSLNQLQPIREINDPLYQVIGNSNLKPSFTNNVGFNVNAYDPKTQQSVFGSLSYNQINNEIVTTETIDENNKRIVSYININGNKSYNSYLSYYRSIAKLNVSFNLNFNYSNSERTAVINKVFNKSITDFYGLSAGLSYYTQKLNVSYRPGLNISRGSSTIGVLFSGNSLTHTHNISSAIQLPYNTEFSTSINLSYRPANAAFKEALNTSQWDSALSMKTLKDKSLQFKISVVDILNQKIGYNRSIGGSTISENTYSYIPRYVLFGINYNLSGNFNKSEK